MPILLFLIAITCGSVVAYGTQPFWAQYPHGIEFILLSRRLEWPLVAICMVACLTVIALVVSGKKRVWWLIGLAPVLTLFAHHFAIDPTRAMQVTSQVSLVNADQAGFLSPDDDVVGIIFKDEAYAFPYRCLYASPVAVAADHDERLMVIWSAFANRAVACPIDRTVKPQEIEIVSVPANALLLYNSRLGQFINGITGLTMDGRRPDGFESSLPTQKLPWKTWKALHPLTVVMSQPPGDYGALPNGPIAPYFPMPGGQIPSSRRVAIIQADSPVAIDESAVSGKPLNVISGDNPLLVFRDASGSTRAFYRIANGDLTPRFIPAPANHAPGVAWVDCDSQSTWALDGRVVDGPLKGEKLRPATLEDDVYLDVAQFWMPDLTTITPQPQDIGQPATSTVKAARTPVRRQRPRRQTVSGAF